MHRQPGVTVQSTAPPAHPVTTMRLHQPAPVRRSWAHVLLSTVLVAALVACAEDDHATVTGGPEPAGEHPVVSVSDPGPTPARAALGSPEWSRCELRSSGVSLAHPRGWQLDEPPRRECAAFAPPGADRTTTLVVEAGGPLGTTIAELRRSGWQLAPRPPVPAGVALHGPTGDRARVVLLDDGSTLRVSGREAAPGDPAALSALVDRIATSVRPVRAAATPDAGAGPAAAPATPATPAPRSRVRPDPGSVALTFDDGPHPVWTPQVLDLLDDYGARATFFVVGTQVERHPDLAREIVRRGHSVQNHTWDHARLTQLDDTAVTAQLGDTDRAITAAGAPTPRCMRPPYGSVDERVRAITAAQDQDVVMWNVDTLDWRSPGTDAVIAAAVGAKDRDIILFHDGPGDRSQTIEALPWVLEFLSSSGFGFQRLCADPPTR